jgi:hypothetical protein
VIGVLCLDSSLEACIFKIRGDWVFFYNRGNWVVCANVIQTREYTVCIFPINFSTFDTPTSNEAVCLIDSQNDICVLPISAARLLFLSFLKKCKTHERISVYIYNTMHLNNASFLFLALGWEDAWNGAEWSPKILLICTQLAATWTKRQKSAALSSGSHHAWSLMAVIITAIMPAQKPKAGKTPFRKKGRV